MKMEISTKLAKIESNIFEKITSYLDYHSIYELYSSSKKLSQKLHELEIINILDLRQMDLHENKIIQIFQKSRFTYEKIRLEFKDIGDNIIDLFSNNLKELNLNGCHRIKDEGLLKLELKIKNLKILELYWMPQLTDKSISVIIKNCPNLVNLNLSGCKNITDKSLENINSFCPLIRHIDLTRCSGLTANTFANVCKLKDLHYLNMYALANVNCDFLSVLSLNNLCKLEFFDICGNLNINDIHLKQCTKVFKHLNIYLFKQTWCINLTDEGLKNLIPEIYQLELLSLHGILGITDETINLMKCNKNICKSLTTLDLYGCSNIKNKDKEYLKSIFHFVKVFKHHT